MIAEPSARASNRSPVVVFFVFAFVQVAEHGVSKEAVGSCKNLRLKTIALFFTQAKQLFTFFEKDFGRPAFGILSNDRGSLQPSI